ncbi:MAG: VWA domain-containing protein [Fimbriimonadaceae bacterium]|nr:VWA domain-containing protein [Fimbriimonadaceae bacterium]
MRFLAPMYLLLLPILGLALAWSWRRVGGLAAGRKRWAFILRTMGLIAICVALAGPQWRQPNRGQTVVFVVDRSDSIPETDRRRAEQFVRDAVNRLGPDDLAAVVTFGGRPTIESLPAGKRSVGTFSAEVKGNASDLSAAIRLGSALYPEGRSRRMVLLTDGNETAGDAIQAARVASSQEIQVDTVPLGTRQGTAEAWIVQVDVPSERQADEPFGVAVEVESTVAQKAILTLDRNGTVVDRAQVDLREGRSRFVFDQRITEPGFLRYRVTLEPTEDADVRNNLGAGFVAVRDRSRVLVLQSPETPGELGTALRASGLAVTVRGPEGIPVRSEELQAYDAVILNDTNAKYWETRSMELLRGAVRETGIGLVMVGGENSFLPGGWYRTPIEEALPISMDVRQRKTFPSTSILIVIDASGSMSATEDGVVKLQLAAKAAEDSTRLLAPVDRLGVAGSTDRIELVAPIVELKDKDEVIRNIRTIRPGGGGIYVEPSMQFAAEELAKQNTKVRHLILLADGSDADSHGTSLEIAQKMRADKITTSVVAIGDGKDVSFLQQLAKAGGGNFYLVTKAGKLPAIFTQDVAMMSRSAIEEAVFVPKQVGGDEALNGISEMPALLAYCLADARPLARVSLASPKDDPILAQWQYGLGTSYAFMSDAQSKWARRWVGWDGFGSFWSQLARNVVRRGTSNNYAMRVRQDGPQSRVEITATDNAGNPIQLQPSDVNVSGPDGKPVEVTLDQTAPGVYEAQVASGDIGSYLVTVKEGSSESPRVATSGFSVPYPPEYRSMTTNTALLARVLEVAEGQSLDAPEDALRPRSRPGESVRDIWAWFVAFALALFPIDIAVRRLTVPWAQIFARFRREEPESSADTRIERLRAAKDRLPKRPDDAPVARIYVSPNENSDTAGKEPAAVVPPSPASNLSGSLGAELIKRRKGASAENSKDNE